MQGDAQSVSSLLHHDRKGATLTHTIPRTIKKENILQGRRIAALLLVAQQNPCPDTGLLSYVDQSLFVRDSSLIHNCTLYNGVVGSSLIEDYSRLLLNVLLINHREPSAHR